MYGIFYELTIFRDRFFFDLNAIAWISTYGFFKLQDVLREGKWTGLRDYGQLAYLPHPPLREKVGHFGQKLCTLYTSTSTTLRHIHTGPDRTQHTTSRHIRSPRDIPQRPPPSHFSSIPALKTRYGALGGKHYAEPWSVAKDKNQRHDEDFPTGPLHT